MSADAFDCIGFGRADVKIIVALRETDFCTLAYSDLGLGRNGVGVVKEKKGTETVRNSCASDMLKPH